MNGSMPQAAAVYFSALFPANHAIVLVYHIKHFVAHCTANLFCTAGIVERSCKLHELLQAHSFRSNISSKSSA